MKVQYNHNLKGKFLTDDYKFKKIIYYKDKNIV